MKNTMQVLSHLIAFLLLAVLYYFGAYTFSLDAATLVIYGVCFLLCPFIGLCKLSTFTRVILYVLSLFGLCGGVFIAKELGGAVAALCILALSAVAFGALLVYSSMPKETAETKHLQLRGIKESRARRKILLRHSFAFFFQKSGVLFGLISSYQLLLCLPAPEAVWSAAVLTVLCSFIGLLIYLLLSAPTPASLPVTSKKTRLIIISLLTFFLLLISVYVYVGSQYTAPDPALKDALEAVKIILTPAWISALFAIVPGMLFGLLLSFMGARFFKTVLSGIQLLPTAILAVILYYLFGAESIYPYILPVSIPLFFLGVLGTLESRIRLFPYKDYPISDRKKALNLPLFHLPNLALIPKWIATGVFSSLFLHMTCKETLYALSSLSQTFAALILAAILCILYVLCILTKEVRTLG